jgi:DNA-binding NtrC family response regulator
LSGNLIHILIVDGDASYRLNLSAELKGHGYQVSMASGGHKALELFPQMQFQVVVADMGMQAGNGSELIRLLAEQGKSTPVILTSSDPAVTEEEMKRAGAADWMHKPFSARALMEKVRRVMGLGTSFKYFVNQRRSLLVVSWVGELRVTDADCLQKCREEVAAVTEKFVILNLHGFTGYDPVLAADLVSFQQAIRDTGAWLVLCGLEWSVREQLATKGLVVEGEILPALKDALQYVLEIGMK